MEKFVFLLKTFSDDFIYVKRLLKSFQKYNTENIKMYIVLPKSDSMNMHSNFDKELFNNTEILYEESFSEYLTKVDVHGIRPGYINQEIIKLAFGTKNFAENYMPIDSDGEFIRSFYLSDFIAEDGFPYSILIEDNELKVDPVYFNHCDWTGREKLIKKISSAIDLKSEVMLTAHGFCILSSQIINDLVKKFMKPNHYSFKDLLEISPYEFSWYNMWLQKSNIIPIHIREPLFKTFHTEDQLIRYKWQNITIDDIARGYVGIVVNSNFQPNRGQDTPIDYNSYTPPQHYINIGIKTCITIIMRLSKERIKNYVNCKFNKKNIQKS